MITKIINNSAVNWLAVFGWLAVIFWSSSISDFSAVVGPEGPSDLISSISHVFLFAVLTFLLIRALMASGISRNQAIAWGFLLALGYGLFDEIHQYFVPNREFHFSDWLLDFAGALVVVFGWRLKQAFFIRRF